MSPQMTGDLMQTLVLGASGMLGNAVFRLLSETGGLKVHGTVRSQRAASLLAPHLRDRLIVGLDVADVDALAKLLGDVRPDVVVNCIGLVKQLDDASDPLAAIPVNAILPHRLARLCNLIGARLIHISTDCVFSGARGNYVETDHPDAQDLYGRSKLLGEVICANAVTLRTSIIGTELEGAHSLVGWFLAQQGRVNGFAKAFFSGLPTVELARIIRDHVVPNNGLRGLYHVGSTPISKFELLHLVAEAYDKSIIIERNESFILNRSLDSRRFYEATGYSVPDWPTLVRSMRDFG